MDSKDQGDSFFGLGKVFRVALDLQRHMLDTTVEALKKPASEHNTMLEGMADMVGSILKGVAADPQKLLMRQLELMENHIKLGQNALLRMLGEHPEPLIREPVQDRRFTDPEWTEHFLFDFIKQSYLLSSRAIMQTVEDIGGLDEMEHKRLEYYMRQLISALAPTNFAATNPEVLRKAVETKGENLVQGMRQYLEDKERSSQLLSVAMTDPTAFEVGRNVANTPGKVIHQNRLMQLIQYSPSTDSVYRAPLLIIPSWVNKYYILDLSPKNSFVKWAVEQGFTVFMVSWVNPDSSHREASFEDYMREGILEALDVIEHTTGERKVLSAGYCLGGILLAATLAWMAKKGDDRIIGATYLTTSLDFSDPGEMRIFIDEKIIKPLENQMAEVGYLDGRTLAVGFALLKENELYWNYYVQNYLKGERPSPFDLLYWNSDNTNVPCAVHRFVLRDLHMENALMEPGGIELAGERLNLRDIKVPIYFLATEKDHIAKWRSCYAGVQLHGGQKHFVLAGSGHIVGVVNPPAANKYYYYTNAELAEDADQWLDTAYMHDGSWWNDWLQWSAHHAGDMVPARVPDEALAIEDAPGSYVKRKVHEIAPKPAGLLEEVCEAG